MAVGMIVDALTKGGEGAFRKILWIAGAYFLLLLQNPLVHTSFVRLMSTALRHMQFNLHPAHWWNGCTNCPSAITRKNRPGSLQAKLMRDVDAIDGLYRHLDATPG